MPGAALVRAGHRECVPDPGTECPAFGARPTPRKSGHVMSGHAACMRDSGNVAY